MILRPVSPVSPIGPPITKRPVGLMWYLVSASSRLRWNHGLDHVLAEFPRAVDRCPRVPQCCVEITTASTRIGLPFLSYSTVTWDLPSGLR